MRRIASCLLAAVLMAGCGPQYAGKPSEANNKINFSKGAFGADGNLEFGADTEGTVEGLSVKTAGGGETKIDRLTMKQAPSQTIGSWVGPMQVYRDQLEATGVMYERIATANWNGFAKSIEAAAPVASAYVSALGQLKLAKAQRPQLIDQLSGLVMGGQLSADGMKEIGMEDAIAEAVAAKVAARIEELRAAQPPAN